MDAEDLANYFAQIAADRDNMKQVASLCMRAAAPWAARLHSLRSAVACRPPMPLSRPCRRIFQPADSLRLHASPRLKLKRSQSARLLCRRHFRAVLAHVWLVRTL